MSRLTEVLDDQAVFGQTGDFVSREPEVIAPLDRNVFTEADDLNSNTDRYRAIGVEKLPLPALTTFRRITGAHSAHLAKGYSGQLYREEPDLRAGIFGQRHWIYESNYDRDDDRAPRITRPHIDDSFLCASIGYFGIVGQPMLHYPGEYTLDIGRLRDEGYEVSNQLLDLWAKRRDYRSFVFTAEDRTAANLEDEILGLYEQQIEAKGIKAVEAPVDSIFVQYGHFLHSENDHSKVVGQFRGIVRRLITVSPPK